VADPIHNNNVAMNQIKVLDSFTAASLSIDRSIPPLDRYHACRTTRYLPLIYPNAEKTENCYLQSTEETKLIFVRTESLSNQWIGMERNEPLFIASPLQNRSLHQENIWFPRSHSAQPTTMRLKTAK
jgi:hypothetical protein